MGETLDLEAKFDSDERKQIPKRKELIRNQNQEREEEKGEQKEQKSAPEMAEESEVSKFEVISSASELRIDPSDILNPIELINRQLEDVFGDDSKSYESLIGKHKTQKNEKEKHKATA